MILMTGDKMARRKKSEILREKIETHYWDERLLNGKVPQSVFAMCKELEIEESDFYKHYASVGAIESNFWTTTVTDTIAVLEADEDFLDYDFQQKLLAFYYTYFAHILQYRSRFVECFPKFSFDALKATKGMREAFCAFSETLLTQGLEEQVVADRAKLNQFYDKGLCTQFGAIIQFYRHDESEQFQDTDAFIEKTVAFVLDGLKSGTLESAFDVVRFLLRKSPFVKAE